MTKMTGRVLARCAGRIEGARCAIGTSTGGDSGMTTAEYAVGTVAACGFGGILYKILTSTDVANMLRDLIERALSTAF